MARHEPRVAALQYAAAAQAYPDPALLERAADVAAETLQPSLQAAIAARWIRVAPESLDARHAAARAALNLQHVEQAAAQYRVVIQNAPAGMEAAFAEIESDLRSEDNVFGARQVADRLAAYFPSSLSAVRVAGLAELRADDPAAAVRNLTRVVSAENPEAQGARDLAQTLLRARIMAGDVDEPLSQARQALAKDDTAANRFDYIMLLLTAQRPAEAAEQLRLLAADPQLKPVALRLLGLLEFEQGHFDEAAVSFRQLLETGRSIDDAFYYLGLIAERGEDIEAALRLYSQVRGGDNALSALLRAGALLHTHGAAPAAEELFDRLSEDEPQRAPEIQNARARMYADSGDLSKAGGVLDRALLEYPDNVELHYALASLFEEQGRVPAALHELTLLLKSRPDDPAALNALGFTLADHSKQLSRARRLIERAHAAAPRNAAILDSLGWVLYRQGLVPEAVPYLRAAYTDDHGGDIAAHLGEVLWRLGSREDALRIWSEAGAVDGDNRLLKSTRRRLEAAN